VVTAALTVTGTYTILVKDDLYYTGNYALTWQRPNNPCNAVAVEVGQVVTGTIGTTAGTPPWKFYTFTGAVNDAVTIRGRATSGNLAPYLELYGPTGSYITGALTKIDRTLTAAGTYTVLVRDNTNTYTGNFTFTWQRLNNPGSATAIDCGMAVVGSLGIVGDTDYYTFSAAASDVVTIRGTTTSGSITPHLELYTPTGSRIGDANNTITVTLTVTGTYTILVKDDLYYTGNYALTWQRMNNPCNATAADAGQVVTGAIGTTAGIPPWKFYMFTGAVNDAVTIRGRATSGNLAPYLELYGPTGSYITGALSKIDRTVTAAGTYTVLVRDNTNTYTGNFTFTWQRVNNPGSATAIDCGTAVVGSLGIAGDTDYYSFSASTGDMIMLRGTTTSGSITPHLELYTPMGSRIGDANNTITVTLTVTGTYTILVTNDTTSTGNYALTWQRMSNPCNATAMSAGQVVTGAVGATAETPPWKFYTFTGAANDVVTVRVGTTSGYLAPYLELYGPTGSYVTGASSKIDRTLTAAGTYMVLVRDNTTINTGTFVFTWQRWNNPGNVSPMSCGESFTGSLNFVGDMHYVGFSASANDVVTVRGSRTSGNLSPHLELYSPSGSRIGDANAEITVTLPLAGVYTALVRDESTFTGGYAITWQRVNNPCLATPIRCGQTLVGALEEYGELDAYSFTAVAGDNFSFVMIPLSGGIDPKLELYNSSGTKIAEQHASSSTQVTLTQTLSSGGNYTLLASDYLGNEKGQYSLELRRNGGICLETTVEAPNGGEQIVASSIWTIRWTVRSSDPIASQEIRLSTDGGQTYPSMVVSGLGGTVRQHDWDVPAGLSTNTARIRVTVTDSFGRNASDASDADFIVFPRTGRRYVYDELNRLIRVIYEDGRRVTYTYDGNGNRLTLYHD
jgi:YD repeat-containing protein